MDDPAFGADDVANPLRRRRTQKTTFSDDRQTDGELELYRETRGDARLLSHCTLG